MLLRGHLLLNGPWKKRNLPETAAAHRPALWKTTLSLHPPLWTQWVEGACIKTCFYWRAVTPCYQNAALHERRDLFMYCHQLALLKFPRHHGKCKDEALKSSFGTIWVAVYWIWLLRTKLCSQALYTCTTWEVWRGQHRGALSEMLSCHWFFAVYSFFLPEGHCWVKESSQNSFCERQVSHSNEQGARVLGKIWIRWITLCQK